MPPIGGLSQQSVVVLDTLFPGENKKQMSTSSQIGGERGQYGKRRFQRP
jgi:hypothetical protein